MFTHARQCRPKLLRRRFMGIIFLCSMGIGIFFMQQLVCCTFLDPNHVRYGVVVYSQSHL